MNEFLSSQAFALLLGFFFSWLLFELTERRKVRRAQQEIQRALVAELESAEVVVSQSVTKYARLCENEADEALVANEARWFYNIGRQRVQDFGILDDLPSSVSEFMNLDDKTIVQFYSRINETIGNTLILPIVDRALSAHPSGFSPPYSSNP